MASYLITAEQLKKIIAPKVFRPSEFELILETLHRVQEKFELKTKMRLCHFLAQVLHESGAFKYRGEIWGNTAAQQRYDVRVDLGNTPERDGDGYTYRGRGWIQLTGKANYRAASNFFGLDFVSKPDLAGEYPYVGLIAGWYWHKHKLNVMADRDELTKITKKINGGVNGLSDRLKWLGRCKDVLIRQPEPVETEAAV